MPINNKTIFSWKTFEFESDKEEIEKYGFCIRDLERMSNDQENYCGTIRKLSASLLKQIKKVDD